MRPGDFPALAALRLPSPGDELRPASSAVSVPLAASTPLKRVYAVGNRCGHTPMVPCFHLLHLPTDANPARPAVIAKAVAKLRQYYQNPRDGCWDALSQGERHHRLEQQIAAVGGLETLAGQKLHAKLIRWRQQRSERREAVILVLTLMVYYTDIKSLKIAIPRSPDWLGLSAPWIADHCGLSLSRTKRALATLARSALVVNTGRGRQFDKRRRCWVGVGWGPIRQFSFQLIRALGLEVSWRQAQRKARKAAVPTPQPPPLSLPPQGRSPASDPSASEVLSPVSPPPPTLTLRQRLQANSGKPAAPRATDPATLELHRRVAALAAQGMSLAEIKKRLKEITPPPDSS